MARSLVAQIGQLRTLDVEGAAVLIATLADSASFDNEQKTMIASAVSSKVLQPSVAHGNPRGTQSLLYPITYFTEADWDVFEDAQAHLGPCGYTQAPLVELDTSIRGDCQTIGQHACSVPLQR